MSALPTTTEELAERAEELARKIKEPPTFVEARAALQEAGVLKARRALEDALDLIDTAQNAHRKAQQSERDADDAVKKAMSEAEWMLAGDVAIEGTKRFVPDGEGRRQVTADEAKAWVAEGARKAPAVVTAITAARKAESERQRAADEINLAERTFSARKADLAAAVATIQLFASSLRKENDR